MFSVTRRTLRYDAVTMLFLLLCLQNVVQVLSEAVLPPPKNIQVDKWQLKWSPATEERNIIYTVQYRSFNMDEWEVVPACVQIAFSSCNVASTKAKEEHGCIMLRVVAERHGLTSIPVKTCSRHGDSCTPEFSLTARAGSLTVHLTRNHSLALEYADHAKYRIYFGKQGEQLQKYEDAASSVTVTELEGGQRYCAKVEYVTYNGPPRLASCIQCELIPESILSEAVLPPPKNIQVDKWQLKWSPATEERNIIYTVQYRSFNMDEWEVVPACVQIAFSSCNVASTKAKEEHGCIMLRVVAERHGLTSIPVKTCSRHGDSCTPEFSLTARAGSLTVHLTRNHSLALEYADHAKYRIYFGKQGEQLQKYEDAASSVTVTELEGGQRYCAKVEYVTYNGSPRLASCIQCELIPESILSEAVLPPPKNIQVDKWQLKWSPATEERNIIYTVQYRSFNMDEWEVVPACVQIAFSSCNVASTKAKEEHGCIMLRVVAERHGLTSIPVKTCSRHGDSCTPEFSLTARAGSLTVHLTRNHSLALEYADHAKYRIYFGKQGEQLQKYEDAASSVTVTELEGGQRYCAKVEYVTYNGPPRLASCIQCELIPESSDSTQTVIKVVVVVVIVLVVVIPGVGYILIFQRAKIKRYLQPRYMMPDLFLEPLPRDHISVLTNSQGDENCDVISSITPEEIQGK